VPTTSLLYPEGMPCDRQGEAKVRGTIKALVMQPRLQVMMNAKAARHSDRPYNQICRNRLAKQHLVIKGGGPFGEGVYPGFDVDDTANAHKLAELNAKSFTIVTTKS
jgi:hypothetical protein